MAASEVFVAISRGVNFANADAYEEEEEEEANVDPATEEAETRADAERARQISRESRATKRREFNALAFGDRPTASSAGPLKSCAEYWTMMHIMEVDRLQPGSIGFSNLIPIGFAGVARLNKIFNDFNSLREGWESYQAKVREANEILQICQVFHMFCNALLRDILGTDKERCLEMVMARNHWTELEDEVLVLASRGSGKTWMLMSAMAAFFVNIPGFTACVYAGTSSKVR